MAVHRTHPSTEGATLVTRRHEVKRIRLAHAATALFVASIFLVGPVPTASAVGTEYTSLVSISTTRAKGNGGSLDAYVSADARYVTFQSDATNLAPGDTNNIRDVFAHDRLTGTTSLVSASAAGVVGAGQSTDPAISKDGRYVTFRSQANNLVSGDTNGTSWDIFTKDLQTGAIDRVSVSTAGVQANGASENPLISADGRYVAFRSSATNLVTGDSNGQHDVFVHDRQASTTTRVSVVTGGAQATGGVSDEPAISDDGRYVAFQSDATNLVTGDSNAKTDIFRHDRQTNTTVRVSVSSAGVQATGVSTDPALNGDGSRVVWESLATNLVSGDTNAKEDVFVRLVATSETIRVSVSTAGVQTTSGSNDASLSTDGTRVGFYSTATNLVSGDTNGRGDAFVRDLVASTTVRKSLTAAGAQVNEASSAPWLAGDGNSIAFASVGTNLVPEDTDATSDVYVRGTDTFSPQAAIAFPEANRPLAGAVQITGTAVDTQSFLDYDLDYGAGASPGSWTTIGTFTTQVGGTGALGTWTTGALSGVYTLRLTVRDSAGNPPAVVSRIVHVESAGRGDEAFHTRVPFDLGGGFGLDVGVHNGEARLARELFSIPSYGPSQALGLSYSSLETGTTGRFGTGWHSNLTQYLSFDATDIVVWHRADGGRVPFGKVGGVWTALAGHFETLSLAGSEYTVLGKDQTKHVFESTGSGRLKRIENRFTKALSLVWNTTSATATDASGRVTNLVIDAGNDRITSVTDSAGRAWSFGYTGTALTSVTDPASKVTTLAYTSGLLTGVTRSRSRVAGAPETITWTIGYTGGKATAVTDPVAATTASTFTYNPTSTTVGLLRATSPSVLRDTWTHAFDALGRVTTMTDPLGYVTTTTYDAASNPTTIATPIGTGSAQSTSTYTYDAKGNVLSETTPIDAATSVTTINTYNPTNDLLTRTDADDDTSVRMVTKYTYDGAGHLTVVNVNCTTAGTTPPTQGQGGTCTGAGTQDASTNLITNLAYTTNDQLAFEQDPLGRVTKYGYDTHGNQTSVTANCTSSGTTPPSPFSSCSGAGTADAQTNVTTTVTFDQAVTAGKAGLPTKTTDALARDTTYTYDALGRQLTEVAPGDTSIPVLTRTMTNDELGNGLTDAEAWTPIGGGSAVTRTTTHIHDLANRETAMTDPAGVTATTTYDLAGNPIGTAAGGVTTTRTFDGLGRTLSATTDGGTTGHVFDAQGNELETSSPEGQLTTRTYTRTGWLLAETIDPAGAALTTTHTHDRLARELTTTDPAALTTTQTYDRTGRQLTSQVTSGPLITTVYDRAGNAVAVKGADARVTASLVDPLDRVVTSITDCTNTGTTPPAAGVTCAGTGTSDNVTNLITRTYYDAAGTPIAVKDAKGITTRTIANVRGLARETIANCTDTGTTPTTNPPACTGTGTANATTNVRSTVVYDGTGVALTTVTAVGTGAAATTYTAYDAAGRVQAVKDPLGTISRSFYDTAGRLTKTVVNCTTTGTTIPTDWIGCTGAGTADGAFNLTTTYGYDAAGNQTSNLAPNGRQTQTTYDDDGRVVTRTDNYSDGIAGTTDDLVTTSFYDDAGRRAAVRAPTASGSTFTVTRLVYDGDGRLWKEIRGCTDTGTTPPADPGACAGTGTANAATNVVTEYQYDARGNRTRLIVPDPAATSGTATATVSSQSAFDAADRLCRVVANATGTTNLQTLTNPCSDATQTAGTTTTNVSTRYAYDAAGNLVTMVDARGNTTTYGYDAAGRMTSLADPLGETLVWVYDALGNRLNQQNRADPPLTASVQWTFDGAGRILTRLADGVTTTYGYDANGNKLTATDGLLTITATYDRLNRVLTVDDEDAGSTADTTYTYSLTAPAWTDPSGAYTATLDKFDRPTAVNDPVNATDFSWSYRADGQPSSLAQPNGNSTAFAYDTLGRLVSKDTTAGATNRALYDWTFNRAGQILSEAETITGGASNGSVTYGYDPLGRLTGSTLGTTTTYGWDKVPNRTTVQVGAGAIATTTYDVANRPTAGTNPTATYTSDDDGRLTTRPGQQLTWDHLGRLTIVKDAAGTTTLAIYTYDPLDRLRTVDHPGTDRTRFRYTGLTTSVAAWLDDAAGTVTRQVANGWTGERLVDWTPGGTNLRIYGTNAHHDTTWLATSTGTVSQALRYDPWGTPRTTVPSGYSPFRFQGSWHDTTTDLAWVVTRWYAPSLGRFVSQDSILGDPIDPPSQHLYAYAQAEPIGRWDPDGRATRYTGEYAARYGDALSRTKKVYYDGAWDRGLRGRVIAAAFLPPKTICYLGACGGGDNRSFSNPFYPNCFDTRLCIEINFDSNWVKYTARPSCGTKAGDCTSAFPIRIDSTSCCYTFLKRENVGVLRSKGSTLTCNKGLVAGWSMSQSYAAFWGGINPTIDGEIKVAACKDWPWDSSPKHARFEVTGDGFPAFEMYYTHDWSWVSYLRWTSGPNPGYLATIIGDQRAVFKWRR